MSTCGFQSESKIITWLALIKLSPRPPALVETRKTWDVEPFFVNSSIWSWRSYKSVEPSNRWNLIPLKSQKSSMMFRFIVKHENIITCSFFLNIFSNNLSTIISFQEASTRCSPYSSAPSGSMPLNRYGWLQTFRSCMRRLLWLVLTESTIFCFTEEEEL